MKEWLLGYLFNEYPPIWISSWGILCLLTGSVVILLVILRSRLIKTRKIQLQEKFREEYEALLTEFVFDEEEYEVGEEKYNALVFRLQRAAKNDIRREVLVATILFLHHDFKGAPEKRLVRLYQDVGLEKYAFRAIRYGSWYEKAFEFTELGQMQVNHGLPLVLNYIGHYSTVLREEAQFAAVRMGGVKNLEYLSELNRSVSDWQQTRIMQELDQFPLEDIPSFYYLLDAKNDSIIVFGLKLISKYRQLDNPDKMVGLLWHENLDVGVAALSALVAIDHFPVADDLPNLFYSHDEQFQPEVIRAIGLLGNDSHIPFLEELLQRNDYDLVMAATKALIRLGYTLPANTTLSSYNKEIYKHARYELIP
ncbi:MAG: HEAT repeat domain-containing protein [Bacteroidota bacterium]